MGTAPGKSPSLSIVPERSPLLEREAELDLIERTLAEASEGGGALLLVEGPAGIGKTRLLEAARERAAARGFQVLRARGGELEREFSHGVVRQLFEPPLAACGEDERAALFAGPARLAGRLLEFAEADEEDARRADASFATLHGLFWLTANLTERAPALLGVDDLHWCDSPSLRFVSYLARRLEGLPVVVAVVVREGEPGMDAAALAELEAEPRARVVRPAPLGVDAVARLLRVALEREPAPQFLEAVHRGCGGNPLLLSELIRAVLAEGIEPSAGGAARVRELGSEALSRFVLQRLRRLGAAAEALARAVAVIGEESDLSVAASLAVLDPGDAAAAAAALGRAEILHPRRPLRFVHPVLRTAVYAELSDHERALAHERAAEFLATGGAAPQHVAAHLLHVPPRARASVVATLREAARRASAEGAADSARAYLERALAEPPAAQERSQVLFELGAAEVRSGTAGATEHLEEALGLMRGEPQSAEVVLALAGGLYAEGRVYEAADELRRTIESLEPRDGVLVERLEAELIHWARFDARLYPLARERLGRLAQHVSEQSVGGRFLVALMASELARAGESPERARKLAERSLAGGLTIGEDVPQAYLNAVSVLVTLDEFDEAVRRYTDLLDLARRRGSVFVFTLASSLRALALLRRGDLTEAEADARTALDAILPFAGKGGYPFVFAYLADALAERGELAEARRTLDSAGMLGEERPTWLTARRLEVGARLRLAAGEVEQGLADLLEVGERLEALGVRNPSHAAWRSDAALAHHRRGDRAEARRLVQEEVELARRWGARRALGLALRTAGIVEGGADALAFLRESVDVLASSPARLERAKSLTELGAALRRANRRAEARGYLQDGLELAERCGAAPVAEQAHAELLATGARPRRLARTGVDALTPSERRVAQMAAQGQTNREIAQALFVTPKTVEMHLSHAYRKLGIQARSQLPHALASEH